MEDRQVRELKNQQRQSLSSIGKSGSFGIVMQYNHIDNTANVLLAADDSEQPGEVLQSVPCPTNMGLQLCAPEPGRMCWVAYRGAPKNHPVILAFFNPHYSYIDQPRQVSSSYTMPRYILEL